MDAAGTVQLDLINAQPDDLGNRRRGVVKQAQQQVIALCDPAAVVAADDGLHLFAREEIRSRAHEARHRYPQGLRNRVPWRGVPRRCELQESAHGSEPDIAAVDAVVTYLLEMRQES